MNHLDEVMALKEAADRWGITADSLKQNCMGRVKNALNESEKKKSGGVWLVTRAGMVRLYGEEKAEK